jgi:hypothetical protein
VWKLPSLPTVPSTSESSRPSGQASMHGSEAHSGVGEDPVQVRRPAEDFPEPATQRPRFKDILGGRLAASSHSLMPPFFSGHVSQLSASVDEDPIDIDRQYEEHGDAWVTPVAEDDKMKGVTEEMVEAGGRSRHCSAASVTAHRLRSRFAGRTFLLMQL